MKRLITLLLTICFLLAALVSTTLLSSCTTARPTYTEQVGTHHYSHDARTLHAEPKPSHIR